MDYGLTCDIISDITMDLELELRFDVGRGAYRITYFFTGDDRIVLLTVFHKQRMNERSEVERARRAMATCIEKQHTAEEER